MRTTYTAVLSVMAFAGVLGGCENAVLDLAPASDLRPAVASAPSEYIGNVLLLDLPERGELVVAIDVAENHGPDSVAEVVYVLHGSEMIGVFAPTANRNPTLLANAAITVTDGALTIRHPDYSATLLLRSRLDRSEPSLGPAAAYWAGHGLSKVVGPWPMSAKALKESAVRGFRCPTGVSATTENMSMADFLSDDQERCASGGVGATSCSIGVGPGSCSVTCDTGYYACCNVLGGCGCVPVAPPET